MLRGGSSSALGPLTGIIFVLLGTHGSANPIYREIVMELYRAVYSPHYCWSSLGGCNLISFNFKRSFTSVAKSASKLTEIEYHSEKVKIAQVRTFRGNNFTVFEFAAVSFMHIPRYICIPSRRFKNM